MTTNVGKIDRALRLLLGLILIGLPLVSGLAIFESNAVTILSVVAGAVMLATSTLRFCPLYRIFGIRTCKI